VAFFFAETGCFSWMIMAYCKRRELCIAAEKWLTSGESSVFRLSRDYVNGLSCIMMTSGRPLSGKDF
jgi:hypothetical protein